MGAAARVVAMEPWPAARSSSAGRIAATALHGASAEGRMGARRAGRCCVARSHRLLKQRGEKKVWPLTLCAVFRSLLSLPASCAPRVLQAYGPGLSQPSFRPSASDVPLCAPS